MAARPVLRWVRVVDAGSPRVWHHLRMGVPKGSRSGAVVSAIVLAFAPVGLGFVGEYMDEPAWIAGHPTALKIALPLLAIVLLVFVAIQPAAAGADAASKAPTRWWSKTVRRNARLMQCLACGEKRWGVQRAGFAGRWECPRCGRTSTIAVDAQDRTTISTPGHGRLRVIQQNHFWGTSILQTERTAETRAKREVMDRGQTVFARSFPNDAIRNEFRAAFLRSFVRTHWRRILLVGAAASWVTVLLELGFRQGKAGLWWHVPAAFVGACLLNTLATIAGGWGAFVRWQRSKKVRYCWLTKPAGEKAFGVLVEDDGWWSIVNLTVRSEAPREIFVELVDDICRYADRNSFILFINASAPEWLIEEFAFERAEVQKRRGFVSLVRHPVRQSRAERRRAKRR